MLRATCTIRYFNILWGTHQHHVLSFSFSIPSQRDKSSLQEYPDIYKQTKSSLENYYLPTPIIIIIFPRHCIFVCVILILSSCTLLEDTFRLNKQEWKKPLFLYASLNWANRNWKELVYMEDTVAKIRLTLLFQSSCPNSIQGCFKKKGNLVI